jgi:uncharacterized protein involved in exopolysaccharide biosynthesis
MHPVRLFRILARRAPVVLATATVVASMVLLATFSTPMSHDAYALARLAPLTVDATGAARAAGSPERAQALASDRVLRAVAEELRLSGDTAVRALRERRGDTAIPLDLWIVAWLRQGISIEAAEGSPLVRVGFRAHDPMLAARIANALVTAPPSPPAPSAARSTSAEAQLRQRLAEAADRLARAQLEADVAVTEPASGAATNRPRGTTDPARARALSNQREQLAGLQRALDDAQRALDALARPAATAPRSTDPRSDLTVIVAAVPATANATLDIAIRVAASIAAGLLAGVVVALIIERVRRPVRDAADLARAAGLPVLGTLCDASDLRRSAEPRTAPAPLPDPPVLTRIVTRTGRRGLAGDAGAARA